MPPQPTNDEIRRSQKNRDKARNERQKNVLLTELAKIQGDRCDELSRQCSELQAKSEALVNRSERLCSAHTFRKGV